MCWKCDLASLGYNPDDPAELQRGGDLIGAFMRRHNATYPEAVEALSHRHRLEYCTFAALYAEHHGLDDEQTRMALMRHVSNGPGRMQ